MAEGTALRLVSRCTTVEEIVRAFRTLVRPDVPDRLDVPTTGSVPTIGTQVRVALTLASKVAVIEGDAEVVDASGRLGLRFTRLDPRSKGLLAHMAEHRDREPPPVPRHLVPLGVMAGTAATARNDAGLAVCVVETLSSGPPPSRASADLGTTLRMPGPIPRREDTLRTVRGPDDRV
ncbi:MAG TPA: hypothetical protein VM734_19800, partial [Kofleriaceae bacterium]|nr:hypothetical protein [Kofleriaceae bacterium]